MISRWYIAHLNNNHSLTLLWQTFCLIFVNLHLPLFVTSQSCFLKFQNMFTQYRQWFDNYIFACSVSTESIHHFGITSYWKLKTPLKPYYVLHHKHNSCIHIHVHTISYYVLSISIIIELSHKDQDWCPRSGIAD